MQAPAVHPEHETFLGLPCAGGLSCRAAHSTVSETRCGCPRPSARRHRLRSPCLFANGRRSLASTPASRGAGREVRYCLPDSPTTDHSRRNELQGRGYRKARRSGPRAGSDIDGAANSRIHPKPDAALHVRANAASFIVFDATDGPCADSAPGYWVLNDPDSNSFYEPGESPGFVHPIPGEVAPTPGPWMRPDRRRATNR
jgi:hypothetical protein